MAIKTERTEVLDLEELMTWGTGQLGEHLSPEVAAVGYVTEGHIMSGLCTGAPGRSQRESEV